MGPRNPGDFQGCHPSLRAGIRPKPGCHHPCGGCRRRHRRHRYGSRAKRVGHAGRRSPAGLHDGGIAGRGGAGHGRRAPFHPLAGRRRSGGRTSLRLVGAATRAGADFHRWKGAGTSAPGLVGFAAELLPATSTSRRSTWPTASPPPPPGTVRRAGWDKALQGQSPFRISGRSCRPKRPGSRSSGASADCPPESRTARYA